MKQIIYATVIDYIMSPF